MTPVGSGPDPLRGPLGSERKRPLRPLADAGTAGYVVSRAALGGRSDADLPADRSGIAEVMREAESVADLPDDHPATRSVARSERNLLQRGDASNG